MDGNYVQSCSLHVIVYQCQRDEQVVQGWTKAKVMYRLLNLYIPPLFLFLSLSLSHLSSPLLLSLSLFLSISLSLSLSHISTLNEVQTNNLRGGIQRSKLSSTSYHGQISGVWRGGDLHTLHGALDWWLTHPDISKLLRWFRLSGLSCNAKRIYL